jgi:MFS family permease
MKPEAPIMSQSPSSAENRETKKTVRTFAAASFLNDMGSDMIYPIWPLFVTSLGANMAVLGFIDGIGDALVSLSQAVSGYISDRIRKRKVFIWLGYLFGMLSRLGYALSAVWQHLIPFRILDRAGKMRGAPRDAMVADVSTDFNRGAHFGLIRSLDNLGAVSGIVICILFIESLGYRNLFLLAAIPSLFAVFLILFGIKEKKPPDSTIYKGITLSDLDGNFRLFLYLSALFALGTFSYSFLLIYAKDLGYTVGSIPLLYLLFTAVASLFSLPFGKLSDKIGRKAVLMLSFVFWSLVCLSVIFVRSYWSMTIVFIFYGLHRAAIDTVQKALVAELGPEAYRASALGGFQMIIGLCALPASLIAGLLWDKINAYAPFYLSLGLTLLAGLMLVFVKEKR